VARSRIANLQKELIEEKANVKRQKKAFLEKDKLLQNRLLNANENTWTFLDKLMEKVSDNFKQKKVK